MEEDQKLKKPKKYKKTKTETNRKEAFFVMNLTNSLDGFMAIYTRSTRANKQRLAGRWMDAGAVSLSLYSQLYLAACIGIAPTLYSYSKLFRCKYTILFLCLS